MKRLSYIALALALAGCRDPVVVVEQAARLASVIDRVEVFVDRNGDGLLQLEESEFVVDSRASADKIIRITFLLPVRRDNFSPIENFIEFNKAPLFPLTEVERVYFDDPSDTTIDGTGTQIVHLDLVDDLFHPGEERQIPVFAVLNLGLFTGIEQEAQFVFVLAKEDLEGRKPPRATFTPGGDLPGWDRPITDEDFANAEVPNGQFCDLLDVLLADVDGRLFGEALADRHEPHGELRYSFDQEMANLVISIQPEDNEGVEFRDSTVGFFTPFQFVATRTGIGLAPDTIYEFSTLSKFGTVNVPILAGTQGNTGLSLMPNFDDQVYQQLIDEGCNDENLYNDFLYRIRTGPIRIKAPLHRGKTNLSNTTPTVEVQFARPADLMMGPPATIQHTLSFELQAFAGVEPWVGSPDRIEQGEIVRDVGVEASSFTLLNLPTSDFDGKVSLFVTVESAAGRFIGRDSIEFFHDVIAPTISESGVQITNDHIDGGVEEICIKADCDVESFTLRVDGGEPIQLDRSDASSISSCFNDRALYCFENVGLGISAGGEIGEVEVDITATDDAGNESNSVTVTTTATCQLPPNKFVQDNAGLRLAAIPDSNGNDAVAYTRNGERQLTYATWNGTQWEREVVFNLPANDATSLFKFGVGIDMVLDESDGQPAICLIEGAIGIDSDGDPTDSEAFSTGTLRIMKRAVDPMSGNGVWSELAALEGPRPIGCSLTNFNGLLHVGFVMPEDQGEQIEALNSAPLVGIVFPFGILSFELPLPSNQGRLIEPGRRLAWDLVLRGDGNRLYYSYRTVQRFHPFGSPGTIVFGYFRQGLGFVSQVVENPDPSTLVPIDTCGDVLIPGEEDPCPFNGGTFRNLTLGAGANFLLTNDTVELVYHRAGAQTVGAPGFESAFLVQKSLEYLRAAIPPDGEPFVFVLTARDEDPGPDGNWQDDGLTTMAGVLLPPQLPAPFPPTNVFHARPSLVLGAQQEKVFVSYPRRFGPSGGDEVVVFSVNRTTGGATLDVVDSRVGAALPRQEAVAHAVIARPDGFALAYRNGATNEVQFARQFGTEMFRGSEPNFCPEFFRSAQIREEWLNLEFENFGEPGDEPSLWDLNCPGTEGLPPNFLFQTFPMVEEFGVRFGFEPTLLNDVLKNARLRDGRGLLKREARVCIPNQEFMDDELRVVNGEPIVADLDACSPGQSDQFDPEVVVTPTASGGANPVVDPIIVPGAQLQACAGNTPGQCSNAEPPEDGRVQFVRFTPTLLAAAFCPPLPDGVETPEGSPVYDPVRGACVYCTESGTGRDGNVLYQGEPPGSVPLELAADATVECRTCAGQDPADFERGLMPAVLSSDGEICTTCTPGSQLLSCAQDTDCTILGAESEFRCAVNAWSGRLGDPGGRVCVKRCLSDADCPLGTCNTEDSNDDDIPDGICVGAGGVEIPSGLDLACRPIGCDRCFENRICHSNDDCPLNHTCSDEIAGTPNSALVRPTPLCVARLMLNPDIIGALGDQGPTLLQQLEASLGSVRVPHRTELEVPGPNGELADFDARIGDVSVSLLSSADERQGLINFRIEFTGEVHIDTDTFLFGELDLTDVSASFGIQPFANRRRPDTPGFAGIGFTLADAVVQAELGGFIEIGDFIETFIETQLGGTAATFMTTILSILDQPGPGRCTFVSGGALNDLPRTCSDGSSESEHLVRVKDDELDVVMRSCR